MNILTPEEIELNHVSRMASELAGPDLPRFQVVAAADSGDLDDFDEDDFDDEFDDDFEEELEDEYELSEFEDVTEDDLVEEDDDLGTLGGDFVDEDAEPEEAPAAQEAEAPPAETKKPKKGARTKPADDEDDIEDED